MSITIYGIRNCDTMKKAFAWLDKHRIDYTFHDYKSKGVDQVALDRFAEKLGWKKVINRAGMTFRKLPEKEKENLTEKRAIALMLAQPSMIKRPIIDLGGGKLLAGFDVAEYKRAFGSR